MNEQELTDKMIKIVEYLESIKEWVNETHDKIETLCEMVEDHENKLNPEGTNNYYSDSYYCEYEETNNYKINKNIEKLKDPLDDY